MMLSPPAFLVAHWSLRQPTPLAETPRALLWRVLLPDGVSAVLKCPCDGAGEEAAAAFLTCWDGQGAVRLLAEHAGALLLEDLPGGSAGDLARAGRDAEATVIIADVAARLQTAAPAARVPPPAGAYLLETWCAPLAGHGGDPDLLRAALLAQSLLQSSPAPQLLHGDLHHDNILRGPRGWCAIDPKGLFGDPAFEFANAFRNPNGLGPAMHDPARALAIAAVFGRTSGSVPRILSWAAVQCALSIHWDRQDCGTAQDDDLRLLPLFLALSSC